MSAIPYSKMRKPDPVPQSSKRASIAGSYDEPPPLSSRSSSSNTADADGDTAIAFGGTARRKKSRAYTPPDEEEESEGAQADAEFGGSRPTTTTGTWGSVDGRRRSVHSSSMRRVEADDVRRHSMAV